MTNEREEMLEKSATLYFGPWYRKSPMFEATRRAGCTAYDIYNHMYLPGYYDDPEVEYYALNNDVTLWDVGVERTVEVSGPDAGRSRRAAATAAERPDPPGRPAPPRRRRTAARASWRRSDRATESTWSSQASTPGVNEPGAGFELPPRTFWDRPPYSRMISDWIRSTFMPWAPFPPVSVWEIIGRARRFLRGGR